MKLHSLGRAALVVVAAWLWPGAAVAQDMPMPKPGPEHKVLELDVGTWDATVEMFMVPGAPPTVSQGTETSTLGCGDSDMTGKVVESKSVGQYKDPNTRVFTMYMTGPDGKEAPSMKITYKRKN